MTPVLQVVHRVITLFLRDQAGLKGGQADSGAVTLIQRFGSAANVHCRPARISWARLLKRVFEIDFEHCPNCGGRLEIIAAIPCKVNTFCPARGPKAIR